MAGTVCSNPSWRHQGKVSPVYFRTDAGFANPDVYEFLDGERIKSLGWTRQVGDDEPDSRITGRRFLQQARHMRAMDQRGQGRDQVDTAVV
jgi:hypothetical protein